MKINEINLHNYRNFKSYKIIFGTSTTVFIGKNGTGKTNLLSALKQSLSFIFANKKESEQFSFLASSDRKVKSYSPTDARFGKVDEMDYIYNYPINISTKATTVSNDYEWQFYKEKQVKGLQTSLYERANIQFWNEYLNTNDIPIFASFSDSYPHIKTNLGKNIQALLKSRNILPRNVAFYKWDDDKNCTEIWSQYFIMQYKNMRLKENSPEIEAYINNIIECIKTFSILEDSPNNESIAIEAIEIEAIIDDKYILIFKFTNGDIVPFDQLPQGYKRIFSIVFDIAHRSYLLNGNCNPQGIIIIDEIELHLHPSLAQEILQRLRNTFQRLQFIVSTHSPLVITNFKQDDDNILYKLYRNEEDGKYSNLRMSDLYGIDYNTGLNFMDTPERDSYIQDLITAHGYWKEMENQDLMDKVKLKLQEYLGENYEENEVYQSLFV